MQAANRLRKSCLYFLELAALRFARLADRSSQDRQRRDRTPDCLYVGEDLKRGPWEAKKWGWIAPSPLNRATSNSSQSTTSVITPEPTVRPPSRIAKWLPTSNATGLSRSTNTTALSPGITISWSA